MSDTDDLLIETDYVGAGSWYIRVQSRFKPVALMAWGSGRDEFRAKREELIAAVRAQVAA